MKKTIALCCFLSLGIMSFGQTSAFNFSAEDSLNDTWHQMGVFTGSKKAFSFMGSFDLDIDKKRGLASNNLLGVQFQKSFKNASLKIAPYIFVKSSSRDNHNEDYRIGTLYEIKNNNAYRVDALINWQWNPMPYIRVEAGKNKHQLGKGINSLLWSGNGGPSWFANASLNTKKISYRTQLNAIPESDKNNVKWIANHTVTVHLPKDWQISLFETVAWAANDSSYNRGFDWQYMAPTVIYRPTEFHGGSADNVLIGLDWSGRLSKNIFTYGQLVIDEFWLEEIKKQEGWWANKYGGQVGLGWKTKKHFAQAEINVVRPFTYSHANTVIAFTNQVVPLAAWDGAGFVEGVMVLKATVNKNLTLGFMSSIGSYKVRNSVNYGGDPFESYLTLDDTRNHTIVGANNEIIGRVAFSSSYQFKTDTSWLLSVWTGVDVHKKRNTMNPWVQLKWSNTLFANFSKKTR